MRMVNEMSILIGIPKIEQIFIACISPYYIIFLTYRDEIILKKVVLGKAFPFVKLNKRCFISFSNKLTNSG